MIPPLTTVRMSQSELAELAFNALVDEMKPEPAISRPHEYTLNTTLIVRRSTALAPSHARRSRVPQGTVGTRVGQTVSSAQAG